MYNGSSWESETLAELLQTVQYLLVDHDLPSAHHHREGKRRGRIIASILFVTLNQGFLMVGGLPFNTIVNYFFAASLHMLCST